MFTQLRTEFHTGVSQQRAAYSCSAPPSLRRRHIFSTPREGRGWRCEGFHLIESILRLLLFPYKSVLGRGLLRIISRNKGGLFKTDFAFHPANESCARPNGWKIWIPSCLLRSRRVQGRGRTHFVPAWSHLEKLSF